MDNNFGTLASVNSVDTNTTPPESSDYSSFVPLQDKYESHTNIVNTIVGGGIATVGDFATSVWNSLTPEKYNVSTEDLLARVDDNALKIYQENPDTIHAASFIGGMFAPTGLALKGMGMLRAGTKGLSWFSEAGKIAQMGKIEEVLQVSGMATKAYKTELASTYLRAGANMLVDNAAMELALIGTMNAHPFMEDYMKDPAKNFMTSMLLGTAVTAPFVMIGERYAARQIGMKVYEDATKVVRRDAQAIEATADVSTKIAQHQNNIDNWEGLLARPETDATVGIDPDTLTGKMLTSYVQQSKAAQIDLLDGMAGPELKTLLSTDVKKAPEMADVIKSVRSNLIDKMTSEPERFAGINYVDLATSKEVIGITQSLKGELKASTLIEGNIPLTTVIKKGDKAGTIEGTRMVYSPKFDSFMLKTDLHNFSTAIDMGVEEKNLLKGLPNNWYRFANTDSALESLSQTSGKIDLEYLQKLKAMDGMEPMHLANINVAADDGSTLNAIVSRIEKLSKEDPIAASEIKVSLTQDINGDRSTSKVGYAELVDALAAYKGESATAALKAGLAAETVALRLNIPLDSIKLLQSGMDWSSVMAKTSGRMSEYTDASLISQYLNPAQRSVVVGTTATKIPVAEIRASLHKSMLDSSDSAIKDFFLQTSKSAIAKDLGNFLTTTDNRVRKDILIKGLGKVTPANVGNKFFQSTDFAFRDLGEAGQVLTQIGKDSVHLYNQATDMVVKPLSPLFEAITKDPAGILEFNTARELNASLKGYREYRNGKFFVQSQEEPWKMVTDPVSGKEVKTRNMVVAQFQGRDFTIKTPAVLAAYDEMAKAGREMYHLNDTYRTTLGIQSINDNGFWMPAFNPRGKYISYALDSDSGATRLLWGNTPEELETAKSAYLASLGVAERKAVQLVDKGLDQALFNKLQGRHDEMFMSSADIGAFHSGASAQARVPTGTAAFSEIANGYEHYMHKTIGNLLELHYSDVIGELDRISSFARQGTEGQPLTLIQKALNAPVDVGKAAKNALLGRSDLNQYVGWQAAQDGIQITSELALQKIAKVMDPILNPAKSFFGSGKTASDKAFESLHQDSIARGIPWPFEGLDDAMAKEVFHVEKITQAPNLTPRVVALSNNLAATMLLKVMELGQPLVNMLSMPVLTSAASQQAFNKSFMGAEIAENFHLGTTKLMYDGVRYMGHPDYQKYRKLGTELGVMTPVISEVSDLLQLSRSFNPGVMQKLENAMNSKMVDMLSKPSNWAEKATREVSFANGVYLAKQAYPNLSDAGVITFARNFVDTAIGNYTAVQRPALFQGTVGTAMGLFQTYMVTLAQQIYRKMELKDYKNLAKMMLTQSTLFGAKGLPGFNLVSEQIGEHFSDQNWDLTTGSYRALPEKAADLLLYGLPSNLGPAVYSRGDIQPRLPNIAGGLQNLAAVNIMQQAASSAATMVGIAKNVGQPGAGMALMEALSVQSISRPVARMSELLTGHAVTRQGNEVAGPEEIYSVPGVLARVFATRGLQEAKAREAMHLNSMYGTLDRDQRQEAIKELATHVRAGTLTNDVMEQVQEQYMRTGSPTGWRSTVNRVMKETDAPGVSAVRNHLRPSAPANMMIDDMD